MSKKANEKTEILHAKSLEDAVKQCKVDAKTWEVDTYSTKELSSGEFLYTIYFKRIKPNGLNLAELGRFISNIKCPPETIYATQKEKGLLAEIGIYDLHVGKLAHKESSGDNYDIKIASRIFKQALDYKINELQKYEVDRILFVCGNDFFQVDNENSETTAGTRQDVDGRFHKMFRAGSKLLIEAIYRLEKIAPVDCIIIAGNHGRVAEFLLGEVLLSHFKDNQNILIDNAACPRKYYTYGKNLIGLTHGDEIKLSILPQLMAAEAPVEWGKAKWRFYKTGHYHGQKVQIDDVGSVLIETLPSLSGVDNWHKKKGFSSNTRAAVTSLYDKEDGLVHKIFFNYKE